MKIYEPSRKTKNILRIVLILLGVCLLLFVVGMLSQFITSLTSSGSVSVNLNPFVCIPYAFTSQSTVAWIIMAMIAVAIFAYCLKMSDHGLPSLGHKDRSANFEYSEKDDFGTARQLTERQIREQMSVVPLKSYKKLEGKMIFGYINDAKKDVVALPTKDWKKGIEYNDNIAVCGNPGTKKSRSFVVNYIMQAVARKESVIVSDTKGEIFGWTSRFAEKHGYTVKILNLVELAHSDGWDILGEIRNNPQKVGILAQVVIDNTGGKDNRDFWANAEENLLKAILLLKAVGRADASNKTGEQPTMRSVYEFTTLSDDEMKNTFDILERNFPDHPAILPFKLFWRADTIRGQIVHGLSVRLQLFLDKQLSAVLGTHDIDLTMPGQTPCIYYLRFSDQQTTYKFITSLFFTFMYIDLVNYADSLQERKLPVTVTMLLDEFCNIGEIPDFGTKIATVRSRGINSIIIIQDIPQISTVYVDGWASIIGCCDTFIFLGCGEGDDTTPEYVSKLSGEATIKASSNAITTGKSEIRATQSTNSRMVFTPNEVRTLDRNKEYVFFNHKDVMVLTKMDFSEHPLAKEIEEINVTDHESRVSVPEVDYDSMVFNSFKSPTEDEESENSDDDANSGSGSNNSGSGKTHNRNNNTKKSKPQRNKGYGSNKVPRIM